MAKLGVFFVVLMLTSPAAAYDGVRPGAGNAPPAAPKSGKHTFVTWPGFQPRPGGARVFVQTTAPPTYETSIEGKRVVVLIRGARVHLRTNRLPLDMRYFNTPVMTAKLERRKKDIALVIDLKEAVVPRISVETNKGYSYLNVDF